MKLTAFICAAAALWAASPALAQVRPQDPQTLVRAMQGAGYAVELSTDAVGDPTIKSSIAGTKFNVFFYNCTNHQDCATVQFYVSYAVSPKISLASINDWNMRQRFGRAFLDKEGDPVMQMDVDLDDGGISEALFADNLEFWTSLVEKFQAHIGYRP